MDFKIFLGALGNISQGAFCLVWHKNHFFLKKWTFRKKSTWESVTPSKFGENFLARKKKNFFFWSKTFFVTNVFYLFLHFHLFLRWATIYSLGTFFTHFTHTSRCLMCTNENVKTKDILRQKNFFDQKFFFFTR